MFGSFGDKLKEKKLAKQQQLTSATNSVSLSNSEGIAADPYKLAAQRTAPTKRQRETDELAPSAPSPVSTPERAPDSSLAPPEPTTPIHPLVDEKSFLAKRQQMLDECHSFLERLPHPNDLNKKSDSVPMYHSGASLTLDQVSRIIELGEMPLIGGRWANATQLMEQKSTIHTTAATHSSETNGSSNSPGSSRSAVVAAMSLLFDDNNGDAAAKKCLPVGTQPHRMAIAQLYRAINWIWYSMLKWRLEMLHRDLRYEVYLAERKALTAQAIRDRGELIATSRERINEFVAADGKLLLLVEAMLWDLSALLLWKPDTSSASSSSTAAQATGPELAIPASLREGLSELSRHAAAGRHDEADSVYYQTLMGSSKWRIGLFTAGDMHIRRSLEKTQREKVKHVMNNETALRSLHGVKLLLSAAQREKWLYPCDFSCAALDG